VPIHNLKSGKTLIVNGPASLRLLEGKASILEYPLPPKKQVVVKSWRSRPVYAHEDSVIEYTFGEGGSIEEVDGNTVPEGWIKIINEVAESDKSILMFIGPPDSGKTSLATLALNIFLKRKMQCIFIDLDVGQSNICPPTTMGYTVLRNPIPDISQARAEYMEAFGYTSPTPLVSRHLECAKRLFNNLLNKYSPQKLVIDVDGWLHGEGAITHKKELVQIFNPDYLIIVGETCQEIGEHLKHHTLEVRELPPPLMVRKRSLEARKKLREMMYEKFLRKSIIRSIPISWVELRYITGENRSYKIASIIDKLINSFSEDKGIVLEEGLEEICKTYKAGILCYLYDINYNFSGIGLLTLFNPRKNLMKIYTPFQSQIKQVTISSLIISVEGSEIFSIPPPILES